MSRQRLTTWPEIAGYIGRDMRTAKRYETARGLPVRRVPGGGKAPVYAFKDELDAWLAQGSEPTAPAPQEAPTSTTPAGKAPSMRVLVAAGAAALVALAVGGGLLLRPPALTQPPSTVVVAALQNDTGDPVFERLIPRLLQINLTQSPRLQVASDAKLTQTLALMERPRDAVLTPGLAREVCVRGDGGVLVAPAATRLGDRFVLTITASDCVGGRVLSQGREVVASKDDVPGALDRLASRTRRDLGESRTSVSRFDVPLLAARTASFDALRAYSEGAWLAGRGEDAEAAPLYRRAIELDPRFGLAWLGLAQSYYHARQWRQDAEATAQAYALRSTLSERDGLFAAYRYHDVVEKDEAAALNSLRALAMIYPHDAGILNSLSFLQFNLGEYAAAIATAEQAVQADPRSPAPRTHLMRALIRSGQPARARRLGDEAFRAGLADSRLGEMRILAASELGDEREADRLLAAAAGTPAERDALLQSASNDYGAGRVRLFLQKIMRADLLGSPKGVKMDWSAFTAAAADTGDLALARRYLPRVEPDLRTGRFHRAQALAGDPSRELADLARDEARWPKDTLRNAEYGPEARAILALRRGDPQAAVRATGAPDPFEWRTLEFPYVRAEALLAAGDGAAATAAFRAVLAHPGWSNWPQYSLAHLGLARALRLQGHREAARVEYDAFLSSWRLADPELPQLNQARRERAALS